MGIDLTNFQNLSNLKFPAMPDGRGPIWQHHGAKGAGTKPEGPLHSGRDFHYGHRGLSNIFDGKATVDGGEGEGVVWGAVKTQKYAVNQPLIQTLLSWVRSG